MIIDFVIRLLQFGGIMILAIVGMLLISIKTQPQWESMRRYAKATSWYRAITNEMAWRDQRRMRIKLRYEYESNEPPT